MPSTDVTMELASIGPYEVFTVVPHGEVSWYLRLAAVGGDSCLAEDEVHLPGADVVAIPQKKPVDGDADLAPEELPKRGPTLDADRITALPAVVRAVGRSGGHAPPWGQQGVAGISPGA